METRSTVSRRDFLLTSGAIVVGFSLRAALPKWARPQTSTGLGDQGRPLDPKEVDSFLAFHSDGTVTLYTSKVDVGTGLRIALSQMASEELGIPVESITVVEGDTGLTPNQGGTGGSSGVPVGGVGIRQAAATARQAILNLAAEKLNRPAVELTIDNATVRPLSGGSSRMGRAARSEFEAKYTIDHNYDCLLQIYRDAIVQRRIDEGKQSSSATPNGASH
jgi:nicotinate dehydrogenase subunit B